MKLTGLTLSEAVKLARELGTRFRDSYTSEWLLYGDVFPVYGAEVLNPKWEVEPPKPKTEMRWQYIIKLHNVSRPYIPNCFFLDENDLKEFYGSLCWFERIEESGREFPVFKK
jgi:hypothetical protein